MIDVVQARSSDRGDWVRLVDPPGEIPSPGSERVAYTSPDGRFECGLWSREPDSWSFERPHDEVAYILAGAATIETSDGSIDVGAGDVLVTTVGSAGAWRVHETLTKCYAICREVPESDATVRVIGPGDPVEWVEIPTELGDPIPPGEEWVAHRSSDASFSAGMWRRVPETGPMELAYDEVACLIEGDVEVESRDGRLAAAGPGDVLVTPKGFTGTWRARTRVRKFWAVYHPPE